MQKKILFTFCLLISVPRVFSLESPELIKDSEMANPDIAAWAPHGAATLSKIKEDGKPVLKIASVRRGSPNAQCGVRGSLGAVAAGDVLQIEMTYRVVKGGSLTLFLGSNMNIGLSGLVSDKDEVLLADVPAKTGGVWSFWLLQSMNARRGEILLKRLSVRILEHGDPARFPIVIDGDMEQRNTVYYGAYNKVRLSKDETVVKSGKRSLHVASYEDDRPGSLYAGVACNFGPFEAKKRLKVSFDIKVATGAITPMMTRGAFDKGYDPIGPCDWKHVEIDYETPLSTWYSIIWTRSSDTPIEFWLDNVVCAIVK